MRVLAFTEELRARMCQDIVSRLYSSWYFVMLQNSHLFLAFSYVSVLNKTMITINNNENAQQSGFYNDFPEACCL